MDKGAKKCRIRHPVAKHVVIVRYIRGKRRSTGEKSICLESEPHTPPISFYAGIRVRQAL